MKISYFGKKFVSSDYFPVRKSLEFAKDFFFEKIVKSWKNPRERNKNLQDSLGSWKNNIINN
jgi:hypothetical protein